MKLIDNWRSEFHRLWTIRISVANGIFLAVAEVISAFTDVFNPWALLTIAVVVNLALIPLGRLVKQAEKPPAVSA